MIQQRKERLPMRLRMEFLPPIGREAVSAERFLVQDLQLRRHIVKALRPEKPPVSGVPAAREPEVMIEPGACRNILRCPPLPPSFRAEPGFHRDRLEQRRFPRPVFADEERHRRMKLQPLQFSKRRDIQRKLLANLWPGKIRRAQKPTAR